MLYDKHAYHEKGTMKKSGLPFLLLAWIACTAPALDNGTPSRDAYRVTGMLIPLTRYADKTRMTGARVLRVVDGDTVKVEIAKPPAGLAASETIRLIGVDTPESVDKRKPIQHFAKEASAYAATRLMGKPVLLAFDKDLRDRYGRLFAYIFLEDGSCFDLELIRQGYGYAYVKYPFFFMDEFRHAELEARYEKRGLWGPGDRQGIPGHQAGQSRQPEKAGTSEASLFRYLEDDIFRECQMTGDLDGLHDSRRHRASSVLVVLSRRYVDRIIGEGSKSHCETVHHLQLFRHRPDRLAGRAYRDGTTLSVLRLGRHHRNHAANARIHVYRCHCCSLLCSGVSPIGR